MRNNDPQIIDAEFRVLNRSRWESWMRQLPNTRTRAAFILTFVAGLVVIGAALMGFIVAGAITGCLLAGVAGVLTDDHQGKGMACLAMAVVLAMSGCSKEPPAPRIAVPANKSTEQVRASILEATRYRDPAEGWKARPLPVPGAAAPQNEDRKESGHADSR